MNELLKGIKELFRIVGLAIVSYLLTEGILDALLLSIGIRLAPETKLVVTGLFVAVLKAVDKWLHELGTSTKNLFMAKGLTRF